MKLQYFSAEDMIDFAEALQPQWIKIESEDDLPKEGFNYYHVISYEDIFSDEPKNQFIDTYWAKDEEKKYEWFKNYSHWMPIIKPQPPKD